MLILNQLAENVLPRILTQICRDPMHLSYGCADRNWWHYKIRDFPSIILQQSGIVLHHAATIDPVHKDWFDQLAKATVLFWNKRACNHGAFEEYYPWENGYPPLAFSTHAAMYLAGRQVVDPQHIIRGVKISSRQLLNRYESQASNQQIAGLAALYLLDASFPGHIPQRKLLHLTKRCLSLQTTEGWFPEYGGPDLGYLSVTLDCLWDIYDITKNAYILNCAEKAFSYILGAVGSSGVSLGMHNSRNTDYIVPYAIARFATYSGDLQPDAMQLLNCLYKNATSPMHFFASVDDRYWSHYIGASLFRAVAHLNKHQSELRSNISVDRQSSNPNITSTHFILECDNARILISLNKGGNLTCTDGARTLISDYGWTITKNKKHYVSNYCLSTWDSSVRSINGGHEIIIRGNLVEAQDLIPTPAIHAFLRLTSYVFGSSIIAELKRLFIFHSPTRNHKFTRTITISKGAINVHDTITNCKDCVIRRSPRSSKRHVSSANSFHREDQYPTGIKPTSVARTWQGTELQIVSNYLLSS